MIVTGNPDNAAKEQRSFIHPTNFISAVERLFGGEPDGDTTGATNLQGEIFYTLLAGWVVGNSVGTALTQKGSGRLHLGPVYVW